MKYNHIIITGATGGLGKSIYEVLSKDKNDRIYHLIGRNEVKFENIYIKENSYKYLYDFSCSMKINKLYEEIYTNLMRFIPERIVFINCIGTIEPICKVEELTYENIDKSIATNLESPIILLSKLTQITSLFKINLDIINITSGVVKNPIKSWSMYSATKAGMRNFLNTLSEEYTNIRVVNLDPGVMDTKMQEYIRNNKSVGFSDIEKFIRYKKDGLLRKTEDVARIIKYAYIDNWICEHEYEHIKKYD